MNLTSKSAKVRPFARDHSWFGQLVADWHQAKGPGRLRQLVIGQHYRDVIMGAIASQITNLTIVYSTIYSDVDQRKHQSSSSLAFVRGIHRGPVNSPRKWPVTRKVFQFDDVIMGSGQRKKPHMEPDRRHRFTIWRIDRTTCHGLSFARWIQYIIWSIVTIRCLSAMLPSKYEGTSTETAPRSTTHCCRDAYQISEQLQWRHNGSDSVSNPQHLDCLLNR